MSYDDGDDDLDPSGSEEREFDAGGDEDLPPREPTEGVRILGAQEAAEATGRHDVVRRGDRNKKFGDRPESPEPTSDLPRITISSSERDSGGDRFGPVPLVPPGGMVNPPQGPDSPDSPGHARVAGPEGAADGPDQAAEPPPFEQAPSEQAPFGSSSAPESAPRESAPPAPEPSAPPMPSDDLGLGGDPAAEDDDDSFVLPHWTEPATGQVPKVVSSADEPTTGTDTPRWRGDGDDSATGFADLEDETGGLSGLAERRARAAFEDEHDDEDDDTASAFFDGEAERDPFDAFGPDADDGDEAEEFVPRRRRAERPGPRRGEPPADDGGGGDRNLPMAVAVGVGLVALGLICFALGTVPTMLLATVVVVAAGLEYFTAVRTVGYNPATLVGLIALGGLVLGPALFGLAAYPVILAITALVGLIWFLLVAPGEGSVPNLGITWLGVVWIGLLGSFAGLFLGLGEVVQDRGGLDSNPGIGVLICAVVASVSYDIGGFFIGRQFGRTPLSQASPNKTQEGFGGGLVVSLIVTTIAAVMISPIGDEGVALAFVFALMCAIAAPIGDLCESFVKRDLGIKDMGSVLPGHGGVLDRFDSLLFVLPVAYFVTLLLGIWSI